MLTVLIILLVLLTLPFLFFSILSLIPAIIGGLIVGGIARLIMPGAQGMKLWETILLGMAGSLFAGLIGAALGLGSLGFIGNILGAFVLLWVFLWYKDTLNPPPVD